MTNAFGITKPHRSAIAMFMDAAYAIGWPAKLDAIKVILSELPPAELERFSNELGREAHMNARARAKEGDGVSLPAPSPHRGENQ